MVQYKKKDEWKSIVVTGTYKKPRRLQHKSHTIP